MFVQGRHATVVELIVSAMTTEELKDANQYACPRYLIDQNSASLFAVLIHGQKLLCLINIFLLQV